MDLGSVILSEVNQTEKEKYHITSLRCGIEKEMIRMNLQNRKRLTDLENELTVAGGRDSQGGWEGHVHTAVFRMDNQQGPIVQHMELFSMFYASLDGRGVWGRMDTCVWMAESLCCSPETTTTLLTGYTSMQSKVYSLKKKKNIYDHKKK